IPHTTRETTLGEKGLGDIVNIECDMLLKHVHHLMQIETQVERSALDKKLLLKNKFYKGGGPMFHTIEEALSDLKKGKPIIVVDDEKRENEGDFVALSDRVTPELINFMITHGKGLVCTTITSERAREL